MSRVPAGDTKWMNGRSKFMKHYSNVYHGDVEIVSEVEREDAETEENFGLMVAPVGTGPPS